MKKQMTKEEFLEEILFRREAEELAGLSRHAFQYHVSKGHIDSCKETGKGTGKVQLFWRDDVLHLIKSWLYS